MSNSSILSLQSLPVEILHRIFDSVNAQTILLSLSNTSWQLKAVISNYYRYILVFKSISGSYFHLLCYLIDPQNIISLILWRWPNIRLDRIISFTLWYSTILTIDEHHLKFILKRVNMDSLISFSLRITKAGDWCSYRTAKLLSSTIIKPNLRKFELDFNRIE